MVNNPIPKVRKQFKRARRIKPGKQDSQDKPAKGIMGKGATRDDKIGGGRGDDTDQGKGASGERTSQVRAKAKRKKEMKKGKKSSQIIGSSSKFTR